MSRVHLQTAVIYLSFVLFSSVSAMADPTLQLTWTDTTGSGTVGGSSISALPGDVLTLDVIVVVDGAGTVGASVSLVWDPGRLEGLSGVDCPSPPNIAPGFCTIDGSSTIFETFFPGVVQLSGSMQSFDAFDLFSVGASNGLLVLGRATFLVVAAGSISVEVGFFNSINDFMSNGANENVTSTTANAMAFAYTCEPQGLIAYWPFSGDATDLGACMLDGVPVGATLVPDAQAMSNSAYAFDGNDLIDLGISGALKPSLPLSILMWIRHDCPTGFCMLFNNDFSFATNYSGIWFQLIDGVLNVNYGDGSGVNSSARRSAVGSSSIPVDTWTHVAVVVRGPTDMDLYLDGVPEPLIYSGTGGPMGYFFNAAEIGSEPSHAQAFVGDIDEVQLFGRALSESEVIALPEPSPHVLLLAGVMMLGVLDALGHRFRCGRSSLVDARAL